MTDENVTLTEEEFEERQRHASVAGENAAFGQALKILQDEAAYLFVQGEDQKANLVREMARKIERLKKDASDRLQVYIDKSLKR